ncbi:MAG: hypothetical protein PVF75_03710 [Granulosicoccaceae bacterium]|jgi:hypothetical protein
MPDTKHAGVYHLFCACDLNSDDESAALLSDVLWLMGKILVPGLFLRVR